MIFLFIDPISWTAVFISLAFSAASYVITRVLGPKPPKITRGQQSGEVFIQNADEGSPVAEIYGAAPSQSLSAVTWTNLTNAFVNSAGNLENDNSGLDECYTDAAGPGDSGAWTVQTITGGDWEVSWTFGPDPGPSGRSFLGVTDGVFSLDHADWHIAIHVSTELNTSGTPHPVNSIFVYKGSGSNVAFSDGTWTEGDALRIRCLDGTITCWHKNSLLYSTTDLPIYPIRVIASMACHDSTVEDIQIVTPAVDNKGGIKTAGTVVWALPPRKVTTREKRGGKGAPKQTVETITYYTDLAILIGRGPLRLKKLWANADLILDLDAAIGDPTGAIDPSGIDPTDYSQDQYPSFFGPPPAVWRAMFSVLRSTNGTFRWYAGDWDQLPDSLIESDVGAGQVPAYRGFAYVVIEGFNISKYGGIPTFSALVENMDYTTLEEIADHLCDRVDVEPGDRDFSVFASQEVRGLIVGQQQSPRQTLELAALPYGADYYETVDGTLKGVYFGGSSVLTIDPDDLGASEGEQSTVGGEQGARLEIGLLDDAQIPRQITVTAFDPYKDHELTAQHAYRMQGFSAGLENIALPMALTPDEIRQAAERLLYQKHVERASFAIKLPWKYGYLEPTNIIQATSGGIAHRLRITQIAGALPGPVEFQCVADQSEVYTQTIAGTSGGGYTPPTVSTPVESLAILLDTVMLRDADNAPGFYAGAVPARDGAWPGAGLYRDRGAGYELVDRFLIPAIAGVTTGSVTSLTTNSLDTTTTITVDLYGTTATLESVTEAAMLNGANAAILGDAQVFQFMTAVQVGGHPNRWTLSNILWSRRGSDHAAGSHSSGSRFVLLDGAIQWIDQDLTERGTARNFKAVTSGYTLSDAGVTSFTWNARTLMPLSVVDVAGSRDMSNNLTITWKRRTRLGGHWADSIDVPLGEETESYEIDVMSGATVLRTITATSETAGYTAAEQTTDGLTPGDPVEVNIYQISALVGRGFVRNATI